MDTNKLYEILEHTTIQLRKGEVVREGESIGNVRVVHVDMMPHVDDAKGVDDVETVDMEFLVIGVHKPSAEKHRADLIAVLNDYPYPDRLAAGPSYIEVGAEIGNQGAAFQLFALGKVLDLWDVITPARLGLTGELASMAAGNGFIMITGYKKAA